MLSLTAFADELERQMGGDRTSPLPSSRHAQYFGGKGWTAVAIHDDPPVENPEPVTVPAALEEHARRDAVGVWRRDSDEIESSCRNAGSLISKGWTFVRLADEGRRRAYAEKRPWPRAKSESITPALESAKQK